MDARKVSISSRNIDINVPHSPISPKSATFGVAEKRDAKKVIATIIPPVKSRRLLGNTRCPSRNLAINHKKRATTTAMLIMTVLPASIGIFVCVGKNKTGRSNIEIYKTQKDAPSKVIPSDFFPPFFFSVSFPVNFFILNILCIGYCPLIQYRHYIPRLCWMQNHGSHRKHPRNPGGV